MSKKFKPIEVKIMYLNSKGKTVTETYAKGFRVIEYEDKIKLEVFANKPCKTIVK